MGKWKLFDVFGVELEYMIVNRDTFDVMPVCDVLLEKTAGELVSEIEFGEMAWSNELVNHVIEFKTNGPAPGFEHLSDSFHTQVLKANEALESMNACLLPTAMHPWMNPFTESKLWPHEYNAIYEAYNRIFDCRGHGWSNLQSTHINLPFNGDEEFAKLHAAIRFLMPLMPALMASSPIADGKNTGQLDYRLHTYRNNSKRIPMVTGRVIPEPVFSKEAYDKEIFQKMYAAIAPHDTDGILQEEWLNSRGAIARFDRGAIEIRILDIQECPKADIAICELISRVLRQLTQNEYAPVSELMKWSTEALDEIYTDVTKTAEITLITNKMYLNNLGISDSRMEAREIWDFLYENSGLELPAAETILDSGSLSTRIVQALYGDISRENLKKVYSKLASCLEINELFEV